MRGGKLWEDNLNEELLHLLLVHGLLEQDVRHGADHVQGPVLLAGRRTRSLDVEKRVNRICQFFLMKT